MSLNSGETLERINPWDELIYDSNGNLVGIKSRRANGQDMRSSYLGAFTWANLPNAIYYSGFTALVTDVGASPGMLMVSDGVRWVISSPNTVNHQAFRDDFRRADTAAGTIGAGWTLKGAYVASYPLPAATTGEISNHTFTNAGGAVVYATRTLRSTPRQLQCRWSWVDDGVGTDFTTLAMIISSSSNLIDTMLHITIINSQLLIQKRLSGGAFTNLVSPVTISPSLALTDVPHVATITVVGTSVRVQIDDAVDQVVTDSDVATIVGPYIAVEHYSATTSVRWPMTIYEVTTS